jgi:hypothetical protein
MAHHRTLSRGRRTLAILLALTIASVAFAMDVPFDPAAWGGNPVVAIAALIAFVAWFRSTPYGARVDGPIIVPAFTLAVGASAGALLQLANALAYQPYAAWATPLGGLAYGALVAASAVFGVSLFNYGAKKVSSTTVAITPANTAIQFITDLLKQRFALAIPVGAWNAVRGLLSRYALHEGVLTDDLRATIQRQVLDALRAAGLPGVDLE